jgi:hypothetical protein
MISYTSDNRYEIMQNYRDIIERVAALPDFTEKPSLLGICHCELDTIRVQGVNEVDYDYHAATIEILNDRFYFWVEVSK